MFHVNGLPMSCPSLLQDLNVSHARFNLHVWSAAAIDGAIGNSECMRPTPAEALRFTAIVCLILTSTLPIELRSEICLRLIEQIRGTLPAPVCRLPMDR